MVVVVACEDERFVEHVRYVCEYLFDRQPCEWRVQSYRRLEEELTRGADAVIAYGLRPPHRSRVDLHIYACGLLGDDYLKPWPEDVRKVARYQDIPVPFIKEASAHPVRITERGIETDLDLIAAAFCALTRYEEAVRDIRDRHDRFPGHVSLACANGYHLRPVVDEYAALLHDWLRTLGLLPPRVASQEDESTLTVCLSHDIDDLRKFGAMPPLGTLRRGLTSSDPLVRSWRVARDYVRSRRGGIDPFLDSAYWMTDAEKSLGVRSTFFVMADGTRYSCEGSDAGHLLAHLLAEGFEIAVHAGHASHTGVPNLLGERRTLERAVGRELLGNRYHYLRWDVRSSPRDLSSAGFVYDSSAGYPEGQGFRTGACRPHRLFDFSSSRTTSCWEMPVVLMDTGLYATYDGDHSKMVAAARDMMKTIRSHSGVMTCLWHNTLYEVDKPGGRALYRELLSEARGIGGAFQTLADVALSICASTREIQR